jgi:hypothetical protein
MTPMKTKCPECGHEVDACFVCGKYSKFLTPHQYHGEEIYLCNHCENKMDHDIGVDKHKLVTTWLEQNG